MNRLTEKDKSYIAAMFDGEGHLTLCINVKPKSVGFSVTPQAGVTNTNIKLLNYLETITGIGIVRPGGPKKNGQKQKYIWNLRVEEMKQLLPVIHSDLVIKGRQCSLLIEFLNMRWSNPLTLEQNAIRYEMVQEVEYLNRRGD